MQGFLNIVFLLQCLNSFNVNASQSSTENASANEFVDVDVPGLGKIRGKVGESFFTRRPIYHFLGVNYAEAPSKEKRFKTPVKFPPWKGVFNATKMRQNCPQASTSYYPPLDPEEVNITDDVEDCLVLNVFTPKVMATDGLLLPVMYYIHGGSFYAGSAYDFFPDFLLEEDMVLVVVQYRLGILGFLSLDMDEIPGNLGMLDILLGLEWVQDNIFYFGGNASEVTVVGQSAGAAAASSLLISPLVSPGLFHKIIIQSGSSLSSWAVDDEPVKSALSIAKFLKCQSQNLTEIAKCFQTATVDDLIKAHAQFETKDMARCGTSLVVQTAGSRKYLVEHPRVSYAKGKFLKIPMMGGITREEGTSFVAGFYYGQGLNKLNDSKYYERNVTRDVLRFCGGFREGLEIMADYLHNMYFQNITTSSFEQVAPGLVDMCGVLLLKGSTFENLRFLSPHVPTFAYSFNFYGNVSKLRASDPAWNNREPLPPGVAHSDELGYLFPSYKSNYTLRELQMVRLMTSLWSNFIKTGYSTRLLSSVSL
ncbi:hypothetical protein RUM44_007476 [Polyplax serrata]|uniref:Carboxylic ester hydrolase n=1 Tax=Polyplax serrata TaxID=468196 RepID=A0ABR1B2E8_POLSC